MAVTNRLVYSPSNASAGSTVGSHVLAGDDGTAIGHVADALKVDIGSVSDLDIRDLTHLSDSIKIGDGVEFLAINADGSINATVSATDFDIRALTTADEVTVYQGTDPWVVSATDLDIRDLSHASDSIRLGDGTSLLTSTLEGAKQALDVYVANSIDVDDGIANTAIANAAKPVSTTLISAITSALASRKYASFANMGNKALFFGGAGTTKDTGFPLFPGGTAEWRIGPAVDIQVIGDTAASSEDLRTLEFS